MWLGKSRRNPTARFDMWLSDIRTYMIENENKWKIFYFWRKKMEIFEFLFLEEPK